MFIKEELNTKITAECDVLVCGGGIAGISASLAAARMGKRVILLEKQYLLGGLATAGLITIYLPLCDGMGKQVSFGTAEELLKLSVSMGYEDLYPENWLDSNDPAGRNAHSKRYEVRYNPHLFAILAEQLLLKEGVQILYGTYAVNAYTENSRIQAVITENKSGRQGIKAQAVVDATGDADIAYLAGVPTSTTEKGNTVAGWYYYNGKDGYDLRFLNFEEEKDEEGRITCRPFEGVRFTGTEGEELSKITQLSHKFTLEDIKKKRVTDPDHLPVTTAALPQVRMTRKINGEYTLHDTEMHKYFEDSVGMVSDWRKRGPVYEVPFRTLYSDKIKNLFAAGRCVSVTEEMWDIMRVIPCCAVTGQAAGTAAALTADTGNTDIKTLQKALTENGAVLHREKHG